MKFAALIWAALWRRPVEAVLTWIAMTAAFVLFGMMIGLYRDKELQFTAGLSNEIWVLPRFPSDPYVGLPLSVGKSLERFRGVSAVGAWQHFDGYRRGPDDPVDIDMVTEGMRHARPDAPVKKQQWNRLFADPSGILVSQELAQKLQLKAGDRLPINTPPGIRADGGTTSIFHVLDVIPQDPLFTDGVIWGNANYIENVLALDRRGVGYAFIVSVVDPAKAIEVSQAIDAHFLNSDAPTYSIPFRIDEEQQANQNINYATLTWGVAGAGLLMALFLVGNGIARSIRERLSEFAVLITLGYSQRLLMGLVFAEAAVPCLIGSLWGTGLATLVLQLPMRYVPDALRILFERQDLSIEVYVWAVFFALAVAFASSVAPLLKLRRLSVASALSGQ